jgi:hypothetical protein
MVVRRLMRILIGVLVEVGAALLLPAHQARLYLRDLLAEMAATELHQHYLGNLYFMLVVEAGVHLHPLSHLMRVMAEQVV